MKTLLQFFALCACLTIWLFSGTGITRAQVYATVPYSTGFEAGIDASWTTVSSLPTGEISTFLSGSLVWSTQTAYAHTGSYFMGMHHTSAGGGAYNTNQANLHLNLNGESNVRFGIWWAEWNDETEVQDGIYISDDNGVTYTKVLDLFGASYTDLVWYHFDMSLDSINAVHGLNFSSNYIIRIQQYDNYYFAGGNDGFLVDDIEVYNVCNTSSTINPSVCDQYTAPDGAVYTSSGTYTAIIPNAAACDSVITINLAVNNTSSSISPTACDSYIAPDGQVYTNSGMYNATIPNAAGCDSLITINLTVGYTDSSLTVVDTCDSFAWTDGNTYTSSGMYSQVLTNSTGCDSVAILDLNLNSSSSSVLNEVAIDSFNLNGQVYTATGIYTQTIPNAAGCDSVITLNLTVGYTGIQDLSLSKLTIYPNPVKDQFIITGLENAGLINELFITDGKGAVVLNLDKSASIFQLNGISPGLYYLNLRSDTGTKMVKFIVQ